MTVVCTGSIAYDYILTFKGHFKDHILLDKTHILNLSFLVDDLQKRRGGVAGNYAYNLALLGHPAGYCFCTAWHWQVRRALGYRDPGSYIELLFSMGGLPVNAGQAAALAYGGFGLALLGAVWVRCGCACAGDMRRLAKRCSQSATHGRMRMRA